MRYRKLLQQTIRFGWMLIFLTGCGPTPAATLTTVASLSRTPTFNAPPPTGTATSPTSIDTPVPLSGTPAIPSSTDTPLPLTKTTPPTATDTATPAEITETVTVTSTGAVAPWTGSVLIEGGQGATGGIAGQTIQIDTEFAAASSFGRVDQMRVKSAYGGSCATESGMATADWEPFATSKTFSITLAINWIGFYVSAQFQDEHGNLSPVYCDDISVEGMPPITPQAGSTSWPILIQCFSENEVYPGPGQTIRGETITFSWPDKNNLPEGVFYKVFAYGAGDNYAALVASGQTSETSIALQIPPERAGDIAWYITLVDANGNLLDHGQCSSFPASMLSVDPPTGIKGIHFRYRP